MAGETIVVVDAGQELDQRVSATLEAEGYLVYPVSSQDVNAESGELLTPSLIYIKPLDLSPTGLKPCGAIHAIPLFNKVPIVILTSLKITLGPDDLRDYGIVDFLGLTFNPKELIEMTRTILGKKLPSVNPKKDEPIASPRTAGKMREKRSPLLLAGVGVVILLAIIVVGFLAYRQFMPARKGTPSSAVKGIIRTPSPVPKAGPKAQPAPVNKVAGTPAPVSPVPSTSAKEESKPQPPPATKIAETSAPVSSVPPKLAGKTSSVSLEGKGEGEGKPASVAPSKPFCSAQLGAFKKEVMAEALAKEFREKGYDAFTHLGVAKDGSPVYRVLVGRYEDRKAARKLGREIESKEGVQTSVYGK